MMTQAEKGKNFRALHERNRAFIIPNPWDVGTARLLAHLGFEALATTSAGYAFSAVIISIANYPSKMMHHEPSCERSFRIERSFAHHERERSIYEFIAQAP